MNPAAVAATAEGIWYSCRAQAGGPGSDAAGEYYRYLQTLGLGPQIYSQPPAAQR